MYVQNLKFVALPVLEIIGVLKKFGESLDMTTLPFLQNFKWAFVRMDSVNVSAKLKCVALAVPVIIAIEVMGGGCEPPILGKRRP